MADSWGNFLYEPHGVVAMSPLNSESSIKLLDVLIMDAILIYFVLVFVIAEGDEAGDEAGDKEIFTQD
jgi:hypothetical protein